MALPSRARSYWPRSRAAAPAESRPRADRVFSDLPEELVLHAASDRRAPPRCRTRRRRASRRRSAIERHEALLIDHRAIRRDFERMPELVRDGGNQLIPRQRRPDLHAEIRWSPATPRQQDSPGHLRGQPERGFDVHDHVGRVNLVDQLGEGA